MGDIAPDARFQWLKDDVSAVLKAVHDSHEDLSNAIADSEKRTTIDVDKLEKRVENLERFRLASSVTIAVMMLGIANNSDWLPALLSNL